MTSRQHRIDGKMRLRRMAAAPGDGDFECIGRRHDRALADRKLPQRQAGRVVHSVDLADVVLLEEAVLDHGERSRAALFRRLEDHCHGAPEVAGFCQILRRPKEHGGMAIMAAGMCLSRRLRCPWLPARLQDR
jgi:hypothetical protein